MQSVQPTQYTVNSRNSYITKETTKAGFSGVMEKASASHSMDDIFERASVQYDVPVSLLKAIAKAESNFNPKAQSHAGAQGVMQLMPATARSLGVTDPFDAEQNILGGAKYIGQMLKRYDGNTALALAAYNAGSGNVAKYNGIPPFKETQNYVRKVMAYAGQELEAGNYSPSVSAAHSPEEERINQSILDFEDFTQEDYEMFLKLIVASLRYKAEQSLTDMMNFDALDSDTLVGTDWETKQEQSAVRMWDMAEDSVAQISSGVSADTAALMTNFQKMYE